MSFRISSLAQGCLLMLAAGAAVASSHREAPFITTAPKVDATDIVLPTADLLPKVIPLPTPGPSMRPTPAVEPVPARPRNDPGLWVTEADYRSSWINREWTGTARFRVHTPFREATALISVEAGGVIETFVRPLSLGPRILRAETAALAAVMGLLWMGVSPLTAGLVARIRACTSCSTNAWRSTSRASLRRCSGSLIASGETSRSACNSARNASAKPASGGR